MVLIEKKKQTNKQTKKTDDLSRSDNQRTLVLTTTFVPQNSAVKKNLLL